MMSKRFAYAVDKRYLPLLVPFGLRGSKGGVTLTDEGSLLAQAARRSWMLPTG
jgi:hypothetical protein